MSNVQTNESRGRVLHEMPHLAEVMSSCLHSGEERERNVALFCLSACVSKANNDGLLYAAQNHLNWAQEVGGMDSALILCFFRRLPQICRQFKRRRI